MKRCVLRRALRVLFPSLFLPAVVFAARPNFVVIMADDLGYGDVSAYGSVALRTPHIDRLATEGVRFTGGYCSASTCTPTRYSFLTGAYAFRRKGTGIAPPNSPLVVPVGEPTIASVLKSAGYRTAVIGKWHLGLGGPPGPDWNGHIKPGPRELGFDYSFLLPTTNDRVPQVFVEDGRVAGLDPKDPLWVGDKSPSPDHPTGITHRQTLKMDWSHGHNQTIHNGISRIGFYTGGQTARFRDEDLADRWVEKAVAWITAERDRPFFLFLASHDPHVPRVPHERFQGKSGLGPRGDAILQFDWCVGEVTAALERLGLAEKTLVIVCSDNGPVMDDGYVDFALEKRGDHRAGGPLRGGKYSVYEGGTRTPFIARWKSAVAPRVSDEVVCTIDLASSFAALAGQPVPVNGFPDSFDVSGALLGRPGAKGRASLVQQDNGQAGNYGYRAGNWKLVRHDSKQAYNQRVEEQLRNTPVPAFQLFDLAKDIGESKDLSTAHPEVLERMKSELVGIITSGRSRP